ncbi:unnamed protein product, partial [Ectocarpus sp. 13 AM-2016]
HWWYITHSAGEIRKEWLRSLSLRAVLSHVLHEASARWGWKVALFPSLRLELQAASLVGQSHNSSPTQPEQRRPHGHVGYASVAFRSTRCCCLYPCLVQDVCSFNGSADNDFRCDYHFLRRHASAISRYNGVYYRPGVSRDSRYNGACC